MSAKRLYTSRSLPHFNHVAELLLGVLALLGACVPAHGQGPDASKLIGGTISTFAGSKDPNASVAFDSVPANNSQIGQPGFFTIDADGNLYFSYLNGSPGISVVYAGKKVPPLLALRVPSPRSGYQYRIAGTLSATLGSDPTCAPPSTCGDGGPALLPSGSTNPLLLPLGITVDAAGNLYIADESEQSIRKVSATDGTISTIAGDPMHAQNGYNGDGILASSALLNLPNAVKFDNAGNLYIADGGNSLIRRIDKISGQISTIAGNVAAATAANGSGSFTPDCSASTDNCGEGGAPLLATLGFVFGMSFDPNDNLFLAESDIHVVREINLSAPSPVIHTVAGTLRTACSPPNLPAPPQCGDTGPATSALLNVPNDVLADAFGNVVIADQIDNAVRLVTASNGNIQTIAGQIAAIAGYGGDIGPATAAFLNGPVSLSLDIAGNLYIAGVYSNTATGYGTSLSRQVTPPPTYTINFPAISPATYGTGPISLNATVNQTRAPAASYRLVSGPGAISGSTLTVTGAGTITVEADQPGDSSYAAARPVTQTVTIAPAVLTVTATDLSRPPGTDNPPLTYKITGFVNNDTVSVLTGAPVLTTTATTSSPFGSYPITVTLGTLLANSNYTLTTVNGVLSVTQGLTQTVSLAAIPNVIYGANAITLSATASPSNLPVTLSATGPAKIQGTTLVVTGAGTVVVTATQAGNLTYAAAAPVSQSFTVAPAALTIAPANVSRAYGAANPQFSFTADGLVGGDTTAVLSGAPIYTTTATTTSDVGSYPITLTQGNLFAQNYTFTFATGTLSITQAPQTITFGDVQDVTYQNHETVTAVSSSALPVQLTTSGPVTGGGSSPIVVVPTDIGPVTVTGTQAGSKNYAPAASVSVSFNTVRAPLNVYVSSVSRPVGAANPTLQYSLQSVNLTDPVAPPYVTGIPDLATTATESSPPGDYPIVATQGTLTAEHYFFVFNNGTLTVTAASSYIITTTPTTLTIPRGSTRQLTVTVTQVNNYSGSVTMGCSGLPAGVTCSFSPETINIPVPTVAGDVTPPLQGTLTITANGPTASVAPLDLSGRSAPLAAGLFLPAGLAGLFLMAGRRRLMKSALIRNGLMLTILVCLMSALTACGSAGSASAGQALPGTAIIQITGTGTASDGAANLNQSTNLSLTVQ